MRNNEIETGKNRVKIGNNGLIEPECCFGPDCCFREPVQYRCLYDHSVLWHSLFCCRVFIAIRRFAAGIQIKQGLPGPLGHAWHPMPTAIHHMRMACLKLHPSAGCLAGYGPWHEHPLPTPPCSGLPWRLFIFLEQGTDMPDPKPDPKSRQVSPRSGHIVLGK